MLSILFTIFFGLNLLSTLLVLSACVVAGRAETASDIDEVAISQSVQLKSALNRISTVPSPSIAPRL